MTALETPPMKLLRMEVENVKRISLAYVDFDPEHAVTVVRGDNAQGKSSLLDAFMIAIGGKRMRPAQVIRDGAEEARITIDLGQHPRAPELVVEYVCKSNGKEHLEVKNADGVAQRSPQELLNSLVSPYTFDPVDFLSLAPKDQADKVRLALGLDFTELDRARDETFSERTLVNREIDRLKARLSALPRPAADAPVKVDLQQLLAEHERLTAIQTANAQKASAAREAEARLSSAMREYKTAEALVTNLEQQLKTAKERLVDLEARGKTARADANAAVATATAIEDVDLDLATLKAQITDAEALNESARKAHERDEISEQLKTKEAESDALTKKITQIEGEKQNQLMLAKFPVPGISFVSTGLALNDLPFTQASQAERLRVAVALGLMTRSPIRTIFIRQGSLLDQHSMKLLSEIVTEFKAQAVVEAVGKDGPGPCVVINDGRVEEVRQ